MPLDTLLYALRAILPILLIMALGYGFKRFGSWGSAVFKQINSLCFHLFLPINLFCNVYGVGTLSEMNWRLPGYLIVGVLASLLLGILAARLFVPERRQKGVLIQASFRANHAILGLPLAEALGGAAAVSFASVTTAVCVPIYNSLAVLVLSYYGEQKHASISDLFKRVIRNPLIQSTMFAVILVALRNLLGWEQPVLKQMPAVWSALQSLSKVASPLMIFVLGAGLDFRAVGKLLPKVTLGVLLRLVISPALAVGVALLLREPLGLTVVEIPALIAVFASPVAVSSVVMTQEIGGDDQLASQLVVWTSVCSMLTIFILVYLLRAIGAL